MLQKKKIQQEYKGTARAMIYTIEDNIGYIYITLHRKELENLFLNSKEILKHDQQKYFKWLKTTDIDVLERSGWLPGGKVENPSLQPWQATEWEKIETLKKELKEEMNILFNKDYQILSNSRDQTRKKESREYKKFLETNKKIKKERFEKNKEEIIKKNMRNQKDKIIQTTVPGCLTIWAWEHYDFNLNKQEQREDINENYHLAYDINIDLAKLKSTEEEAMYEIWWFTKLPVHTIHDKNWEITLDSYDATFANVLKFPADKKAYHKIRIDTQIKADIVHAIKEDKIKNR